MAKQKTTLPLTVLQVINKWKLNRADLASKIDMPKGTFNNKLNPDHAATFSDKEQNQLCNILIEMRNDLEKVEGADFNEALSILSK